MCTGQLVSNIILRQHDLSDPCEILRFVFLYPEKLRCRKSGKCDIRRILGKLVLADLIVQVIHLLLCTSIIPQDRRADHLVILIQNNQTMHLTAKADTANLGSINSTKQLLQTITYRTPPVLRLLLRPARLREIQRILSRNTATDLSCIIHQQQLHSRSTQIHSDKIHIVLLNRARARNHLNL